jgi:hypothetical protein
MRQDLARRLVVGLLGVLIALGSTPHKPAIQPPVFSTQGDPGNGSGGGG